MDLINIIEKKVNIDGEPYYFNTETMEKYGEIVGGLAWPEPQEGYLVIVAVDLFGNKELEGNHIRVLAEASESDINTFLRYALNLQRQFSPFMETLRFYGDTTSLAMMERLDQFNKDRRHKGLDPFYLTEAPQLKDPNGPEFYAQLIRKFIQPGKKLLHFCDTALPCYLRGLSPEEINRNALGHPPVAALGYALAVLSNWRPRKRNNEGKTNYERTCSSKGGEKNDYF